MGWWHKLTSAITKPFKQVAKAVGSVLGSAVGAITGKSADTGTSEVSVNYSAPAVAAPEASSGQTESDLVSRKKKTTSKGKKALLVDSGGAGGSGGTTGTGLNL